MDRNLICLVHGKREASADAAHARWRGICRTGSAASSASNRHNKGWRIGTWNVRGLNKPGKLANICKEMTRMNIQILGLAETFWKDNKEFYTSLPSGEEFKVFTCGEGSHRKGVGFVISKELCTYVKETWRVSDRIIALRLAGTPRDYLLVQVYAPTNEHPKEETEEFYELLSKCMEKKKFNDVVIPMGDFNAIVGQGRNQALIGEYGLGLRNENGQHLVNFCTQNNLCIGNTWFEHKESKRHTWVSPDGKTKNQIDYVLIDSRYRNAILNCKSMPGADGDSDHNPVVANIRIKLKKPGHSKKESRWDMTLLNDSKTCASFAERVERQLTQDEEQLAKATMIQRWDAMKGVLTNAANETLIIKKQKRKQPWMTESILDMMEKRREAKMKNHEEDRLRLDKDIRKRCREEKEKWYEKECQEIEELAEKHNESKIFQKLKNLQPHNRILPAGIKDRNGKNLYEKTEIKCRWEEYGRELYGSDEREVLEIQVMQDHFLQIEHNEVLDAITRLKNNKAPGLDNISAEFLKNMGEKATTLITRIIQDIYCTGMLPQDFTKSIMIPIPKVNNTRDCDKHRTISLVSHASKILLDIILQRMRKQIEENLGKEQKGFRKGVGTREAIFQLRHLIQRSVRENRTLCICFIDFEKAFDRIQHGKLIEILNSINIDKYNIQIIKNMYCNQEAAFRVNNELTEWFNIERGVRQGCLLSPALFNLYSEMFFREAIEGIAGISVGGQNLTNIRYADDTAIVTRKRSEMKKALDNINKIGVLYGIKINIKKTKIMTFNPNDRDMDFNIEGGKIEIVKSFNYLGSLVTEDGRSTVEVKRRIALAKDAFWKCKEFLRRNLNMQLKARLLKCYVWPVLLYSCETWTWNKEITRLINSFDVWCYRRLLKIKWIDRVSNEEVWRRAGTEYSLVKTAEKRKWSYAGHILRGAAGEDLLTTLEGYICGYKRRGRPRRMWTDDLKEWSKESYATLKKQAQDRDKWRSMVANLRFGDGT